jgi:pantetheine-phosphate adenylyltransferase
MRYRKVAVGGTFSFFHPGHRHLLKYALEVGETVIVGVTSDEFAKALGKQHPIEPYEVRALRVLRYCLRKARVGQRVVVLPIDDAGGPASNDPSVEAIIATEETAIRAIDVSVKRTKLGLKPVAVEVVEHVLGVDGQPISSTRLWHSFTKSQRE